jgi:hypothetical protein
VSLEEVGACRTAKVRFLIGNKTRTTVRCSPLHSILGTRLRKPKPHHRMLNATGAIMVMLHCGSSSPLKCRMLREVLMPCRACQSDNLTMFPRELCIHLPGWLEALDKGHVFVFPQLLHFCFLNRLCPMPANDLLHGPVQMKPSRHCLSG